MEIPNKVQRDPVTNFPNRQEFIAHLAAAQDGAGDLIMVTLADARHYNEILRAIGHDYADDFIRRGAGRLRDIVPPEIGIYHVSILSFCFLYTPNPARLIAELMQAFAAPLVTGGIPITTRIGVGLASFNAAIAPADLLRTALSAAQDSRNTDAGWARYDSQSDTAHRRGFLLLSQFPLALAAKDQLSLNFQPKYNFATGKVAGAEALLRWTHPTLGPVSPGEFIPLVETTDYIQPLTDWVLAQAAAEAARWRANGLHLTMAVNISPHNLSHSGFAAHACDTLLRHGAVPADFEFEFTEGALAANHAKVLAELHSLRASGVRIALDDFGTGFSNFSYITHLPADIIKIDQSFIRRIANDERAAAVVVALIELAHRLGYSVVAEGIETAEIYRLLAGWGCDEGQGYYMNRPLTAGAFAQLMGADVND